VIAKLGTSLPPLLQMPILVPLRGR